MNRRNIYLVAVGLTVLMMLSGCSTILPNGSNDGLNPSELEFDFVYSPGDRDVQVAYTSNTSLTQNNTGRLVLENVDTGQTETWSLPVSTGQSISIDAAANETLRVVWVGVDGERRETATEYSVPTVAPQAAWEVEYDGETATVLHNGGDEFNSKNTGALTIENVDTGQQVGLELPVSIADGGSINATNGQTVRVTWTDPKTNQTLVIYESDPLDTR